MKNAFAVGECERREGFADQWNCKDNGGLHSDGVKRSDVKELFDGWKNKQQTEELLWRNISKY